MAARLGGVVVLIVACTLIASPKAASAQSCTLLGGFRGACGTSAGTNQIDTSLSTAFTDYIQTGCPSGRCLLTQGSELCAGVARAIDISRNNEGTGSAYNDYMCVASMSDCVTDSSLQGWSGGNQVCPAGQVCCKVKVGPPTSAAGGTAAGTGAKSAPQTAKQLPDPLGGVNIPTFIGNVIRTFAGIAGTIALCMFVYGGIMLIISGGEQAKVQNGRKILVNATIGLLFIFSAYTFVSAIISAILAE